ncbi:alkaline phosphatase family protein [Streptacidiphilus sp. PB12-B1b]|uniref:alkaline phosphatase family protein n=1 Tax=Streptacidiphilus sp. PB12-B1b TaxID=2705012 RepID=UPI0015FA630D|nr:alkaline phosphatase family protein [Streptacidiphilus sp. PB12-B1b]QMU77877.1 alkaline phosphatase family protein [Streptacidiphilus sp. PB12-B1b]
MPEVVERQLRAASRGVVVLAIDGLSYEAAEQTLPHARLRPLRSTFPSTSTTAWLTSVTGVGAADHGVVGMVYRAPGADRVTHLVSGRESGFGPQQRGRNATPATELVRPTPTVFDRCAAAGLPALVIGAELQQLTGAWAAALLHGARLLPSPDIAPSPDPSAVAERTVREIEAVLADPPAEAPCLLWAYVNLDDHIHRAGYDSRLRAAVRLLDEAATRWADAGWSVLAHADHGLAPVAPRADLLEAWARLDSPSHCSLPGGGAGRVRWMYPRPGHEDRLAAELADALGEQALVLTPEDLDRRGLLPASPAVRDRIGAVVAVAASPGFPVPDPGLAWEHGALSEAEMLVPLAAWGPDPALIF